MEKRMVTASQIGELREYLQDEEREGSTIEKYLRDVQGFISWLSGAEAAKECTAKWKEHLKAEGYQPETINSKLSALNKFFRFLGWEDCRVKYLKVQHKLFRSSEKELTKEEYVRLL